MTLSIALLAGVACCAYAADGVDAGQWLMACVGIPLIVALVNLRSDGSLSRAPIRPGSSA